MARVPCDPAQVIVNHASFRVELGSDPEPPPAPVPTAAAPGARRGGRRPLVWSGRAAPGDPAAGSLLQAVRERGAGQDGVTTQVLPRVTETTVLPSVVPQRGPHPGERGPAGGRPDPTPADATSGGLTDPAAVDDAARSEAPEERFDAAPGDAEEPPPPAAGHRGGDARAHFYPGRRLDLGIVLLPLRLLLGFITITAGFAKLTDPVYFDGGERGSMVTWLASLEPWAVAAPLHDWALAHPVGAGLTVAFVQIIVGVLTIAGLWQRAAAVLGALLSVALLVTVAWQSGPAYDAPDIILLAAWSPLIIAGAPVYSMDARLAGEAWRRLGPRVPLRELRRRVLRRGAVCALLLLGATLLVGSLLGGAVRSTDFTPEPRPGEPPRNSRPGSPLPSESAGQQDDEAPADGVEETGPDETPGEEVPDAQDAAPDEGTEGEPPPEQSTPETEQGGEAPGAQESPEAPPAGQQDVPDGGGGTGDPVPEPPATGGVEPPPAEEETTNPPDEGGEESSPGPIGGLLG